MKYKIRIILAIFLILILLSQNISIFLINVRATEQKYRILMDFYHGGWDGYEGYKTISQLLTEEGYIVEKNFNKPINMINLSNYNAILFTYPKTPFNQEELNSIKEYVYNGGGLLLVVDTQMFWGYNAPNQVAGLFGVHFYGDFEGLFATIVNFDHPITKDKKQEDLFNPFILWDAAIDKYPSNATILVKATITLSNVPNGTSALVIPPTSSTNIVAMIALNYGEGRAVFGPCNGLVQPWGTEWYKRNEPNKMLLNTVRWLCYTCKEQLIEELIDLNRRVHDTIKNHINILAEVYTKVYVETRLNPAWELVKWAIGYIAGIYTEDFLKENALHLYYLIQEQKPLIQQVKAIELYNLLKDLYEYLKDNPELDYLTIKNMHNETLMNMNIMHNNQLFNDIPSYLIRMDEELQTLILNLNDRTIPDDICEEMIIEIRRIKDCVVKVQKEEISIIYIDFSQENILQARVAGALSNYLRCVDNLIDWFKKFSTANDALTILTFGGVIFKVTITFFGFGAVVIGTVPLETVSGGLITGFQVGSLTTKITRDLTKEEALSIVETQALPTTIIEIESIGTVYFATLKRVEKWIEMGKYSAEISLEIEPSYVMEAWFADTFPPSFNGIVQCHANIISNRDAPAAILVEIFESGNNYIKGIVGQRFDVKQNIKEEVNLNCPFSGILDSFSPKFYSVAIEVAIGPKIYTYNMILKVDIMGISLVQGASTSSFSREIKQGEFVSYQINVPPGASDLIIALNYAGSDLDLHLYDSHGRHVGLNYETNKIDLQIPNARYGGPNVTREWIIISNLTSPENFIVKVIGVKVYGETSFSVTYLILTKAILISPVALVVCPDGSTYYEIILTNFGKKEETYVLNLEGLKQGWYSFDQRTISIKPGETVKVKLKIKVPNDTHIGSYPFSVSAENIIGKVYACLKVEKPENIKMSILKLLKGLKEYINELPSECFSKEQNISQMKKALLNKIDAIIKMIKENAYNGAINKLKNDILAKMDGDPEPKDWIINPISQEWLKNYINWIIINIKALI